MKTYRSKTGTTYINAYYEGKYVSWGNDDSEEEINTIEEFENMIQKEGWTKVWQTNYTH